MGRGKKKSEGCSELMCALISFIQPKSAMRYMRSFSHKTSNLFFTAQTSGQVQAAQVKPEQVFLCDFLLQLGGRGRNSSSMLMNKIHTAPEKPNTTNHLEPSIRCSMMQMLPSRYGRKIFRKLNGRVLQSIQRRGTSCLGFSSLINQSKCNTKKNSLDGKSDFSAKPP